MKKQMILTIGREFGSGGHEIAQKLADYYKLPLYDSNILKEIADVRNIDSDLLAEYDEVHKKPIISRTVRGMSSSPEQNIANMQFDFLKKKAEAGESFVVVGRCAETILKQYPAVISIFVLGDKEKKLERIMDKYQLSLEKAERLMLHTDRKRKQYHNSYCPIKWGDSRNYDISINSSKQGVEGTVRMLIEYIGIRMQDVEKC